VPVGDEDDGQRGKQAKKKCSRGENKQQRLWAVRTMGGDWWWAAGRVSNKEQRVDTMSTTVSTSRAGIR